jgi:hypothetical protein
VTTSSEEEKGSWSESEGRGRQIESGGQENSCITGWG